MDNDSSHLSSQRSSPSVLSSAAGQTSVFWFSFKVASVIVLVVFGYAAVLRTWNSLLKWREKSYRLAMRRRHGIPDSDHRPFNVAHAAVLRARQEREIQERSSRAALPAQQFVKEDQSSRRQPRESGERRNVMPGWWDRSPSRPPLSSQPASPPSATPFNDHVPKTTSHHVDRHNFSSPVARLSNRLQFPKSYPRPYKKPFVCPNESYREDFSEDDEDDEPVKKRHFDDSSFPMDDVDSDVPELTEIFTGRHRRGAKRLYGEEDDDVAESKRTRGKRARKFSKEYQPAEGDQMMVDEDDDEITALRSLSRGKKRDRAEAGSTFGGDDEDSVTGTDSEDGDKARQRRKRRSVTKRRSEVHTRGKKRDRDTDRHDVDDEDTDQPKSRKKREKRYSEDEGYQGSDRSMDDSHISQDPLCHGRRIGDEWEVNSVRYKVGPNGERLRQALVKKARSKFLMPKDSQHPDRQANLEVFVETWLTEEQYNEAKDQQQLAWQDSPKVLVDSSILDDVPITPSKAGKDLLWSTPGRDGASKKNPFRQSIATTVGLHVNPFQQPLTRPGRRITSAFVGDLGSPKIPLRSFSKWEKQDLEAEAMARLRERRRTADTVKSVATAASTTTFPSPIALPVEQTPSAETKTAPFISFGVSPALVNAPSAPDPSKAAAAAPTFAFNIAPTSEAPPTPATTSTAQARQSQPVNISASTGGPATPSIPTFHFTPPSAAPAPAQAAAPSLLSVPGFNALKTPRAPAANVPSSLATPASPNPTQSKSGQKPTFSFSTPNNSSSATRSPFSFGVSGIPSNTASVSSQVESQRKPEQSAGVAKGSTSLMDRIGGFAASPSSDSATTSETTLYPGSTSFVKPTTVNVTAGNQSTPVFNLGIPTTTAAGATPGPKFDFGFGNKANNPPTTSAPPSATPNPASPFGAPQPFVQAKPAEPAMSKAPFGTLPGATFGHAFGNQNIRPDQTGPVKSAFSGLGGSRPPSFTAPAPLLSSSMSTSGGSVFGETAWATTSATPSQSFAFQPVGASTTKPTETKSAFSMPSADVNASENLKPSSSFPEQKPEFKFNFSANAVPQPSIFGAQPAKKGTRGSGFGKSGTSTATAPSTKNSDQLPFGKPTSTPSVFSAQVSSQTEPSMPTFNFGVSAFTNASTNAQSENDIDKSATGNTPPDKPPSNAFGTPSASTGFSFSAPPPPPPSSEQQQQ